MELKSVSDAMSCLGVHLNGRHLLLWVVMTGVVIELAGR